MPRHTRMLTPFGGHGMLSELERSGNFSPRCHPFSLVEDSIREIDQQFGYIRQEMNSMFGGLQGFDQNIPGNLSLKPEVIGEGEKSKYRLNVPVGNISPENVTVSLKDRVLTIEAKKEEKSEDGCSRNYQEFSRQFTLPVAVDLKEIKSILTPEGVLKIEAPLPQQALPEPTKPVEIPILMEN